MEGEVMVVTIVAIGCLTGIITTWINSKKKSSGIDEEIFDRLAKAFIEHKKDMQKRMQNLEAIIAGEEEKDHYSTIEEHRDEGTLSNDLEKRSRTRS